MTTRILDQDVHSAPAAETGGGIVQRNTELVRSILLRICDAPLPVPMSYLVDEGATEQDIAILNYHLEELHRLGYVIGQPSKTFDGPDWLNLNLSFHGHDFLEAIRDPEHWRQTKAGAAKVGNWTIKTLADIALGLVKARVEQFIAGGGLSSL